MLHNFQNGHIIKSFYVTISHNRPVGGTWAYITIIVSSNSKRRISCINISELNSLLISLLILVTFALDGFVACFFSHLASIFSVI